jgi:restriction system protein
MNDPWYKFQEQICTHFKSLGFDAETNKTIEGVRTNHDIDVPAR